MNFKIVDLNGKSVLMNDFDGDIYISRLSKHEGQTPSDISIIMCL